jgi:hypothetical protein
LTENPTSPASPSSESQALDSLDPLDDSDGRDLYSPHSKYPPGAIRQQRKEGYYVGAILIACLVFLSLVGLGVLHSALRALGIDDEICVAANRYALLAGAGLLGGTVYGGKWLYHAVAKGLWHEDRKLWRYLSPWISLGTTIGIGALIEAGFMHDPVGNVDHFTAGKIIGLGFLIGYLSDRFLAKMKELTEVLFGTSEHHDGRSAKKIKNDNSSDMNQPP